MWQSSRPLAIVGYHLQNLVSVLRSQAAATALAREEQADVLAALRAAKLSAETEMDAAQSSLKAALSELRGVEQVSAVVVRALLLAAESAVAICPADREIGPVKQRFNTITLSDHLRGRAQEREDVTRRLQSLAAEAEGAASSHAAEQQRLQGKIATLEAELAQQRTALEVVLLDLEAAQAQQEASSSSADVVEGTLEEVQRALAAAKHDLAASRAALAEVNNAKLTLETRLQASEVRVDIRARRVSWHGVGASIASQLVLSSGRKADGGCHTRRRSRTQRPTQK